jgi:hypothetical protein
LWEIEVDVHGKEAASKRAASFYEMGSTTARRY